MAEAHNKLPDSRVLVARCCALIAQGEFSQCRQLLGTDWDAAKWFAERDIDASEDFIREMMSATGKADFETAIIDIMSTESITSCCQLYLLQGLCDVADGQLDAARRSTVAALEQMCALLPRHPNADAERLLTMTTSAQESPDEKERHAVSALRFFVISGQWSAARKWLPSVQLSEESPFAGTLLRLRKRIEEAGEPN